MVRCFTFFTSLLWILSAYGETVTVKERDGLLDLARDGFVHYTPRETRTIDQIHYDAARQYLVFQLRAGYYHRCGVPEDVVKAWVDADSPANYYMRHIRNDYECGDDYPLY